MAFTTSLITNTGAGETAAAYVFVNVINESDSSDATIELQLFQVVNTGEPKIPLAHFSYIVPAAVVDVRTFYISGVAAYEVQLDVTGIPNYLVMFSVFGVDEFGNLVPTQRVLNEELSYIPSLTRIP
jgi:hypothetical protein